MEKILPISLKLNSTPDTLGCYGLKYINYVTTNIFVIEEIFEESCPRMKWVNPSISVKETPTQFLFNLAPKLF